MTGVVNINYENANDYLTGNYHTIKYNKIALKLSGVSALINVNAYINLNTSALNLTPSPVNLSKSSHPSIISASGLKYL